MHVEWRREETSRPEGVASEGNSALAESIRVEIAASGPVTFARFMERALYDPEVGYYSTAVTRPTRSGDFLTAPELHPIFGGTLAVQVEEMWHRLGEPPDFAIREFGAGSGVLFSGLVGGLQRIGSRLADIVVYEPVDLPAQIAVIGQRLELEGLRGRMRSPSVEMTGLVLANEFLDALPVHRVIALNEKLREIYIDWRDDRFVEVAGPLTDDRIAAWFDDANVKLAEGQRAEANLAMLDWLERVGKDLRQGYVMVIDYGAGAAELYGRARPNGTIRAFSGHQVSSDVLSGVGERDITSHVDFDALERAAPAFGFRVAGRRRSNEFLISCGLDDAYQEARAQADVDWDAATNLRSAIQRLLDPSALGGYLIAVLARSAPIEPELRGFAEINRAR